MKTSISSKPNPAKSLLTPVERELLIEVRDNLQRRWDAARQAANGEEVLEAKVASLEAEIDRLNRKLDPLDDAQCSKLFAKVSQRDLILQKLNESSGYDDDPNASATPARACLELLRELPGVLRPILARQMDRQVAEICETLAPLFSDAGRARQVAYQTDRISWYQSALHFYNLVDVKESQAEEFIEWIDELLAGHDPILARIQ